MVSNVKKKLIIPFKCLIRNYLINYKSLCKDTCIQTLNKNTIPGFKSLII